MDPPDAGSRNGDHQMLRRPRRGDDRPLVAAIGSGSDGPPLMFEVRHVGGALARRAEGSGALGALDGEFMTFAVGIPFGPEMRRRSWRSWRRSGRR